RNALASLAVAVIAILTARPRILRQILRLNSSEFDTSIGLIPDLSVDELSPSVRNKMALIVGGTRGVGFGTALALFRAGADVTLVGRSQESGSAAVDRIKRLSAVAEYPHRGASLTYIKGDIGTVSSSQALVENIVFQGGRYDYVVVTAATFPDWERPLWNDDGIDKCFAIAVVGRYIVYKNAHRFTMPGARFLNVLASGERLPVDLFDRSVVRDRPSSSLFENMMTFACGNEMMMEGLFQRSPYFADSNVVFASTHPGMLKTDLHRGQGFWFDILETVAVAVIGRTEEDSGHHQASVLVSDKLTPGLNFVDSLGYGRLRDPRLDELIESNLDWLWNLLQSLEATHVDHM
ncbi:hypothetical protein THAOC_36696, partial [Thalassiosira oceanica]